MQMHITISFVITGLLQVARTAS